MKFVRAFHKLDAANVNQTIGVDESGQVFLASGLTEAKNTDREPFAEFTPEDALKFAFELANLARYAKTRKPRHHSTEPPAA